MTGAEWSQFVKAHWTYEEREQLKQLILSFKRRPRRGCS